MKEIKRIQTLKRWMKDLSFRITRYRNLGNIEYAEGAEKKYSRHAEEVRRLKNILGENIICDVDKRKGQ